MGEYEVFAQLISTVGFPIFVAGFMMFKQSKDTQEMRDVLQELKTTISLLTATVKGGGNNE